MQITFDPTNKEEREYVQSLLDQFSGTQGTPKPAKKKPTVKSTKPTDHTTKPEPEADAAAEPEHSLKDLQTMVKQYVGRDKEKKAQVKELLSKFDASGVSGLSEDQYDDFAEAMENLGA